MNAKKIFAVTSDSALTASIPPNLRSRLAGNSKFWDFFAHSYVASDDSTPLRQRISVYTLSEAYFREGVRENPLSMGRITPKGIYAIRMALRRTIIAKFHFVRKKIPKNLRIPKICSKFARKTNKHTYGTVQELGF